MYNLTFLVGSRYFYFHARLSRRQTLEIDASDVILLTDVDADWRDKKSILAPMRNVMRSHGVHRGG